MRKSFTTLNKLFSQVPSRIILFSFSFATLSLYSQSDSLKIRELEDVVLHKTGNPNKAQPMSTKSNLSIMENPQPISVVTHEVIEQHQAKQLSDVLQQVNGIYVTSSRGGAQDSFGGRGFIFGNDNLFKNGSRVNSGIFPEVSGLERVEVLKGANAMLYGNVAAGGLVNMITKKPKFKQGGMFSFNTGSWENYKPTLDVYGPLSKNIAFRLNGAYEYSNSFRDVVHSQKHYFNPSFLFNISNKTQLIIEGDYLYLHNTPDFGLGSVTDKKDQSFSLHHLLPDNAFLGANWQYQTVQQATAGITLNHTFSEKWNLSGNVSYQNYTRDYFSTERVQWTKNSVNPSERISWKRPLGRTYTEQNYISAMVNLNGEYTTGSIEHKVLVGADADYNVADAYQYRLEQSYYGTNGNPNGILYIDDPKTWISAENPPVADCIKRNRIPTQRVGIYVQDFAALSDKLKLIAGLRWSYLQNKETEIAYFIGFKDNTTPAGETNDQAFSPKVGLVYMQNDNLTFFGTYTNSFAANTGYDLAGNGLTPSIIDQFELGIKKNIWNNTLSFNITAYQILNRNFFQTADSRSDGSMNTDSLLKDFAGKMRSRGVELDITGNPSPRLNIVAGLSYNHSVYLDTPANFGFVENQRLVRTPATTANLSVFYTLPAIIPGLKLGTNLYFIGDRLGGWNDTKKTLIDRKGITRIMELSDYNTVAFSIGYDFKKVSIMARMNNAFNTQNYIVHENYSINPLAPRNLYLTVGYKF